MFRAEDAMRDLFHEQKSLVTWKQQITKSSVQDLATHWIQSYPCKNKNSQETEKSPRKFLEPSQKPKVIYTDKSLEFGKSCEEVSWNHRTSTETQKITETSAVLLQSGLDDKWWSDSMECYCYLRNVQDFLPDGKAPHERRFGESFKGPIIPFVPLVEYFPNSKRDKDRIHQFGKKVLPGIFLHLALIAGRNWKGDISDSWHCEELEKLDASEIFPRRLQKKSR